MLEIKVDIYSILIISCSKSYFFYILVMQFIECHYVVV